MARSYKYQRRRNLALKLALIQIHVHEQHWDNWDNWNHWNHWNHWNDWNDEDNNEEGRVSTRQAQELKNTGKFPCFLSVKYSHDTSDPLLIIEIHPLSGFTHFWEKEYIKDHHRYHVSVLFESELLKLRDESDSINKEVNRHIANLYEEYNNKVVHDLDISFGKTFMGTLNDASHSLQWLHEKSVRYGDRPIHISF